MATKYEIRKKTNSTGGSDDMVVRIDFDAETAKVGNEEEWGTIQEMDRLFDTCSKRWGKNWDLEKLLLSIRESQID